MVENSIHHPANFAHLKYLKRVVISWENECNRSDPMPKAQQKLQAAKEDLKDFQNMLRIKGGKI